MHRVRSSRIDIGPPRESDLDWLMGQLGRPDVASALGWADGVGAEVYGGYIDGSVLLLPFRDGSGERVGFVLLMQAQPAPVVWSVNVVVPEPSRRNGFTALAALDAMSHLVFDIRREAGLVWLIEPGNGASRVLPRRLGYPKQGELVRGGTTYERYGIGLPEWTARKSRLADRGRPLDYEVSVVPLAEVAHGRVIGAVRGGR